MFLSFKYVSITYYSLVWVTTGYVFIRRKSRERKTENAMRSPTSLHFPVGRFGVFGGWIWIVFFDSPVKKCSTYLNIGVILLVYQYKLEVLIFFVACQVEQFHPSGELLKSILAHFAIILTFMAGGLAVWSDPFFCITLTSSTVEMHFIHIICPWFCLASLWE